ncbi:MAG: prephenate dehydratase domain-containing protein [Bacteroidota bacterium]
MMNHQHQQRRIAIQGFSGAFHEIAAKHFYADDQLQILPAATFGELVEMAEDQQVADGGVMAIENSIAGSILTNYQLLHDSSLKINGEVYLRIKQNLMALPGQQIEDLTEVHSHPMAIAQCRQFFKTYPNIRLIETTDTALSARNIREGQLNGVSVVSIRRILG